MLLAVAGLIAVVGGGAGSGTFASFTAETTNADNYFATGTLLLHNIGTDSQGTATALCKSEANADNDNTGCDALFSVPASDGSSPVWAKLTLTNAGSIDAAHITLDNDGTTCAVAAHTAITETNLGAAGLTSGTPTTTLPLASLSDNLAVGDSLVVAEGGHAQTFTVDAPATASGSPLNVTIKSATPNFDYTSAATVNTSPVFGSAPTDCSGLDLVIAESSTEDYTGFTTDDTGITAGADACTFPNSDGPSCLFANTTTLDSITSTPIDLEGDSAADLTLDAGQSRYFYIGVKPDATGGNEYQNRKFTFNLHWTITQA
jgi:predicted ribosomally synthesized peptide with SipW-like signal peptide